MIFQAPAARRNVSFALLTALCAPCLCAAAARAQDPAPDPEEEARRLRQAAEDELSGGPGPGGKPADEVDRLRRSAQLATEDSEAVERGQLLSAFYSVANRLNSFNPRITAFGDVVGRFSASSHELVEDGRNLDDRIALSEAELDLRADIDPYSKGVLILAFEEEAPGEYEATVEEGYVTLETLPFGFHAQIGRFRVPFGRLNGVHRHDLPQTTRPYALSDQFGEEGLQENGAILSWLAPHIPLTLTVAGMNGENERLFAGPDSDDFAWLGRAELFLQLTDRSFLSLGSSTLFGYNDAPSPVDAPGAPKQESLLVGADVLYKWQWNQFGSVVLQAEAFSLKKETAGGREHAFGAYALAQVQPFQRWYFGLRYDWSNYDGGREDREQYALGAWVSYYTTEFLRIRVGYEHRERESTNGGDPDLDTVFVQLTFVFGSHPVEPFWVNR